MSLMKYWPVAGLQVRTPCLELRMPGLEDLGALAGLAAEGVHDPAVQPFTAEWTDAEPDERAAGAAMALMLGGLAGGSSADTADASRSSSMTQVVRFRSTIEASASLALREGDPYALGFYLYHQRVRSRARFGRSTRPNRPVPRRNPW
ncbi:hypothetical protein ACQP1O_22260 [Nocardia sp. CA-151230]|uniref:hypothetical protein n=1 Tax=Nocardia sp. CA-151230 TaxID=3239982 RepID=UPI003D8DF4B2